MEILLKRVKCAPLLFCLIRADCRALMPSNTLGRTEDRVGRWGWAKEQYRRNKKVLISLSLSPSISVSLALSLPLIQYADCFCTENRLPRYSAWPIYHIDQLIKKSDVHRRLARTVRMREITIFCTFWQRHGARAAQRWRLADTVILLTWPRDI